MTEGELNVWLMRLRVALHGLMLSLEATANAVSAEGPVAGKAWREIAEKVAVRAAIVHELLEEERIPSRADREKLAGMRAAFEKLMEAHAAFERAPNRAAAANALLRVVNEVHAAAAGWRD